MRMGVAASCFLISFDSTLRRNLSVGMPIDLLIYKRTRSKSASTAIQENDPYFRKSRWDGRSDPRRISAYRRIRRGGQLLREERGGDVDTSEKTSAQATAGWLTQADRMIALCSSTTAPQSRSHLNPASGSPRQSVMIPPACLDHRHCRDVVVGFRSKSTTTSIWRQRPGRRRNNRARSASAVPPSSDVFRPHPVARQDAFRFIDEIFAFVRRRRGPAADRRAIPGRGTAAAAGEILSKRRHPNAPLSALSRCTAPSSIPEERHAEMKERVPSIGSTVQTYSLPPSVRPNSSPKMQCEGKRSCRACRGAPSLPCRRCDGLSSALFPPQAGAK